MDANRGQSLVTGSTWFGLVWLHGIRALFQYPIRRLVVDLVKSKKPQDRQFYIWHCFEIWHTLVASRLNAVFPKSRQHVCLVRRRIQMSDVGFVKIISIWCLSVQFGRRSMKSIREDCNEILQKDVLCNIETGSRWPVPYFRDTDSRSPFILVEVWISLDHSSAVDTTNPNLWVEPPTHGKFVVENSVAWIRNYFDLS